MFLPVSFAALFIATYDVYWRAMAEVQEQAAQPVAPAVPMAAPVVMPAPALPAAPANPVEPAEPNPPPAVHM